MMFMTWCSYFLRDVYIIKTSINLHHFVWCNENTWYTIVCNDHTQKWVMSHIWMSHVTHMNESCHTHDNKRYTIIYNDDATKQITLIQSRSKVPYTPAKEPYICLQKSPMSPTSICKSAPFFVCINVHHFLLRWSYLIYHDYIIIYTHDTWQKRTLDTCNTKRTLDTCNTLFCVMSCNTLFCVLYHSIYTCLAS